MLSDIYPLRHPPNTHEGLIAERSHSQRRTTKNTTSTTTTAAATTTSAATRRASDTPPALAHTIQSLKAECEVREDEGNFWRL